MTKAPISAAIMAYNEEAELPSLLESLKDLDEIVLIDHESTDKTAELAKKLGAKVFTEPCSGDYPTEDDVYEFKRRYGFPATFNPSMFFFNAGAMKNSYHKRLKNDWVLWLDCDERLEWKLPNIMELLPLYDVITCKLYKVGEGEQWIDTLKLARNSTTWWTGRIHEMIIGGDLRGTFTDHMVIRHYQVEKPYRASYLPRLEYTFLKDQDNVTCFYLAREYMILVDYKKSMFFFNLYLKFASEGTTIHLTLMYMARIQIELGNYDRAEKYCMKAIQVNPNSKEPLLLMSEIALPKNKAMWKKFANLTEFDRTL